MSARQFSEAFLAGDVDRAVALLDEDVTFHSPVRDYHGRDRVAGVLAMVSRVLGRGEIESVLEGDDETATFFTAQVDDETLQGVLRTEGVADVTLMARPLRVLLPAVEKLQQAAE